jgi:TPR repeat protein
MSKLLRALLIGVMLTAISGIVRAGAFEDGVAAYQRGDSAIAPSVQGNAKVRFPFAVMYDTARVTQDPRELVKWYRIAAEQGDADAQINLALMYYKGQGVAQNYSEAVKWFRLAAEKGLEYAQLNLGLMYAQGQGVSQDYEEAVKWYRLAAEKGDADAQYNLGVMYYRGQGIPQNYLRAHMWSNLAASKLSGDNGRLAAKNRDAVATRLTPTQVVRAQQMARQCEASGFKNCD